MTIDGTSGRGSSTLHITIHGLRARPKNERHPFGAGLITEFSSTLRAPQNLTPLGQIIHPLCPLDWNELTLAPFVDQEIPVPYDTAIISLAPVCRAESDSLLRKQNSEQIFLPLPQRRFVPDPRLRGAGQTPWCATSPRKCYRVSNIFHHV